jgi:undecaprenyl-diphosphatase
VDPVDVGCAVASAKGAYHIMRTASALGHGAVAGALSAGLVVAGRATGRSRLVRLGAVALAGVVVSGVLANALKLVVESPRPSSTASSYGFPSGHTTIAFAFATIVARAYPRLGPPLFLLAVLTAVARLYLQAHFTIDIVGGALLGTASGAVLARLALSDAGHGAGPARRWLWIVPAAAAALLLPFFVSYERVLGAQRARADAIAAAGPPAATVAFGRAEGRAAMLSGWSGDERWAGVAPFVWAEGDHAVLRLGPLARADHDLRLRLAPFVVKDELPCQRVEVEVNGSPAGRLLLDRGWSEYHVRLAGATLRPEDNLLRFRFTSASRGQPSDSRRLAVAFGALEARPTPR